MQLDGYLEPVARQLEATAALGDENTRRVAAGLTAAAGPAMRLALLAALTDAAAEITADLLDTVGSPAVTVHLDGSQARIDVRTSTDAAGVDVSRRDETDATARVSLRLGESLKAAIDAAAERAGISVNTWLARAAEAALRSAPRESRAPVHQSSRHVTGWING